MELLPAELDLRGSSAGGQRLSELQDKMADLLRRAYGVHVCAVNDLLSELTEMNTKHDKAEKARHENFIKGKVLRKKYDGLLEEHKRLKRDLACTSERLSVPCQLCGLLKEQLQQQEKMYERICDMMRRDKDDDRLCVIKQQYEDTVQRSKEASQKLEAEVGRPAPPPADTEAVVIDDDDCHGDDTDNDSEAEVTKVTDGHRSNRLKRSGKRSRCRYNEEPLPESKKSKRSPNCSTKPSKPNKMRRSGSTPPILQHLSDDNNIYAADSAPKVLVPETCEFMVSQVAMDLHVSMDTRSVAKQQPANQKDAEFSRKTRSQRLRSGRPNIVVPETVPVDFDFSDDEDDNDDETDNTVLKTVVGPPSLSSTPVPRSKTRPDLDSALTALSAIRKNTSPETEHLMDSQVPADSSGDGIRGDDAGEDSLPESPVFHANKHLSKKHAIEPRHLGSPSLFDEEDDLNNDDRIQRRNVQCESPMVTSQNADDVSSPLLLPQQSSDVRSPAARSKGGGNLERQLERSSVCPKDFNDVSVQSEPSPSMLCGRTHSVLAGKPSEKPVVTSKPSEKQVVPAKEKTKPSEKLPVLSKVKPSEVVPSREKSKLQRARTKPEIVILEDDAWSPTPRSATSKVVQGQKGTGSPGRKNLKKKSEGPQLGKLVITKATPGEVKQLVQTTISAKMFERKKTRQVAQAERLSEYNGKFHEELSVAEQEELMLQKAKQQSLKEQHFQMELERPGFPTYSEMTGPGFTSTPCVADGNKRTSLGDETVFIKPWTPTTLRSRSRDDPDQGQRSRSHADLEQHQRSRTTPEEEMESCPMSTPPDDINGTINPNIRLSEFIGDTQGDDLPPLKSQQYLEPVSFMDLDMQELDDDPVARSQLRSLVSNLESPNRRGKRSRKVPCVNTSAVSVTDEKYQEGEDYSVTSAVFGTVSEKHLQRLREQGSREEEREQEEEEEEGSCPDVFASQAFPAGGSKDGAAANRRMSFEDSFDRPPRKQEPGYAYVDVVRKHAERRQLNAYTCVQCSDYFDGMGLSVEEKKERMKNCRHKAKFAPPGTPEHFWSIGFPDTQECEDYMNITQAKPSNFRRKRQLQKLFTSEKQEERDKDSGKD